MRAHRRMFLLLGLYCLAASVLAAAPDGRQDLAADQEGVRTRMADLERRLLEVADLIEEERPEVALRLRAALAESRQRFIVAQMATVHSLLAQQDYGAAAERQRRVLADLAAFVALLDPVRAAEGLELLRGAEERLSSLVARQGDVTERTRNVSGRGDHLAGLASEQADIRRDGTAALRDLAGGAGSARLEMALGHMDGASTALKTARAAEALASQLVALSELETALDEVRAAIRRLEEGNVERVRSLLRELLQGALQTQIAVRRDTARLESERGRGEMADRPHRLAAAGLSRRQGTVARSAHQGIALLAEVGGSPALSVALSGVAEDATACALMLADGSTGPPVPGIQQDVELLLARLLEALKGELAPPQELPPVESEEAEPDERQRLLALHSELRVLADLQSGLRSRTARVQKARDAGELADEWAAGEVGRITRSQLGITGALRRIDLALRAAGGR